MKKLCYIVLIVLANVWVSRGQTNAITTNVITTNVITTNAIMTNVTINANASTNVNSNAVNQILALVTTNAPVAKPKPSEIVIKADGPVTFQQVDHGVRAVYYNHVRADSPQLKLQCEWLAADIPESTGQPTNIVAETNVVVDATLDQGKKMHGTGDKMVYTFGIQDGVTNKTVTLWGEPARVETAEVTQTGDKIILDLTRNLLTVPVNPKTVYRENLNGSAAASNAPVMMTNSPPATTNQATAPK